MAPSKSDFFKLVAFGQSTYLTNFLKYSLYILVYFPLISMAFTLASGLSNVDILYFIVALMTILFELLSFNKHWSFLLGTLAKELPFMIFLPNAILTILSIIAAYTPLDRPNYLAVAIDTGNYSSLGFIAFILNSVSVLICAFVHIPNLYRTKLHAHSALLQAGYDASSSSSSLNSNSLWWYLPKLYEFLPIGKYSTTKVGKEVKCVKNVIYSKIKLDESESELGEDSCSVAGILRPYVSAGILNLSCDVYYTDEDEQTQTDEEPLIGKPILLYAHGGAWILGAKDLSPHGGIIMPLIDRAAKEGWVVVSVDYQLCPHVKFPQFLIDVKRAFAFCRTGELHDALISRGETSVGKIDGSIIVCAGDSAGGHITQLMALTENVKKYQPGFEHVDTKVQGVVDMYGVSDVRDNQHSLFFEHIVIQESSRSVEGKALFNECSPLALITERSRSGSRSRSSHAPQPWVSFHGTTDGLVPIADGRAFYNQLFLNMNHTSTSKHHHGKNGVVRVEVVGGFHGFCGFYSIRTKVFVDTVMVMMNFVKNKQGQGQGDAGVVVGGGSVLEVVEAEEVKVEM